MKKEKIRFGKHERNQVTYNPKEKEKTR